MAHWKVRIDYGPEELIVEAPGADEATEKAWNDAIEQLVVNPPEEVEVKPQETPAYIINPPQKLEWIDVRPE